MPQDAFTLRYLTKELNNIFKGGKVNRIIQPSNDELVLTVYTGKRTEKLLLDVNPSAPRMGVIDEDRDSPLTAPNFCMLMRKHLLSATIENISLIGFDRIVKIDFLSSAEFSDSVIKTVYVELMGRYSNVILTENGKILGGNRGINMFDNGVRPLIVGQPYVYPPVGQKKLPDDKSLADIFDNKNINDLVNVITENVQGIANSTAMEIVERYKETNKTETINGNDFFDFLNKFLYHSMADPCVIISGNEVKDVMVFPYKNINGEIQKFDSLYKADDYYFTERARVKKFKAKASRLISIVNTAIKKVKKRLTAIKAKENDALNAEENRIKGELILSYIYMIKQGDSEIVCDNYYDNTKIKITLDKKLSPSKNSERYYKKYNKQKRTLVALKPQREQAEKELSYFESVSDEISICDNVNDLNYVSKELEKEGLVTEKQIPMKKKKENLSFARVYDIMGFTVKAGRNNGENDKLTFTANSEDIWLHAKDYHSSHIIIYADNKKVPDKVIEIAGEICAYYSKGRDGGKTEIVYTEKKNVKKPPKSKPGFVTYDNFKSIISVPNKHEKDEKQQ